MENPLSTSSIKQILLSFMTDYVEYLKELGLEVIHWEDRFGKDFTGGASHSIPTFEAIKDVVCIPTDVVYMQKRNGMNAAILQIGISGGYACVNLFKVESAADNNLDDSDNSEDFAQQCDTIKNRIHLFSCIPCPSFS